MSRRQYTDAEKAAYYKKKAQEARGISTARKPYVSRKASTKPRVKSRKTSDGSSSSWANAAEALGGTAGMAIGGPPGAILGGLLGRGAHAMFKAITGFGDYVVNENSLIGGGMSPPEIINSHMSGGFIVRHREMIADIDAQTSFVVDRYPLNPGSEITFPWLSQIAPSFEEYRFRGLVFEFKSLSSDAVLSSATSSALGAIVMATQYDALDTGFTNKQDMENYMFANSAKPSCSFYHPVECKKSLDVAGGHLYVRTGAVPSNADQRLYDLGVFNIAAVGMQAASGVAGELWCTYEVELFKNKINPNETGATDAFKLLGTVSGSAPLGSATAGSNAILNNNDLGGVLDYSAKTYTFPAQIPPGRLYLVSYFLDATATVTLTAPIITPVNCTIENAFGGGAYSVVVSPPNGATTGRLLMNWVVKITGSQAALIWGTAGTIPSNQFAGDLIITQCESDQFEDF